LPFTGQNLSLRFDRERLWFEFLRAGFTLTDLVQVVHYLQREIRHTRRNVGALNYPTSSNWTALKRTSTSAGASDRPGPTPLRRDSGLNRPPAEQERGRQRALAQLRQLKEKLHQGLL